MLNIAVCGIGRAGMEVIRTIRGSTDFKVTAAFCRDGSEKMGRDIGILAQTGEMGIEAVEVSQADKVFSLMHTDVFIDFSNPAATWSLLNTCSMYGIPGVVCTTGFSEEELNWMKKMAWSHKLGIVYAPNVTLGINVLLSLVKTVSRAMPFFDYQITETHHNKKTDRPSGTAKIIAETIHNEIPAGDVPVNSVRAGGYVGVHEVLAVGDYERLSITHESFSRKAFAQGALTAAKYIHNRKGWHLMEDVIDIHAIISPDNFEEDTHLSRA